MHFNVLLSLLNCRALYNSVWECLHPHCYIPTGLWICSSQGLAAPACRNISAASRFPLCWILLAHEFNVLLCTVHQIPWKSLDIIKCFTPLFCEKQSENFWCNYYCRHESLFSLKVWKVSYNSFQQYKIYIIGTNIHTWYLKDTNQQLEVIMDNHLLWNCQWKIMSFIIALSWFE